MPRPKIQQHGKQEKGKQEKGKGRDEKDASKKKNKKKDKDETGWRLNLKAFSTQLAQIGLKIMDMKGDGNCLFRALADQLEGYQEKHAFYRSEVADYLDANKDQFSPFMPDMDFSDYVSKIRRDGFWGGNMELAAAAGKWDVNIIVHNFQAPRYEVSSPKKNSKTKEIHISYHEGEHYCSVRGEDDENFGPPKPIKIKIKEEKKR